MHIVFGLILLALSGYFWFVLGKDQEERSVRPFVKLIKGIFSTKGYNYVAKALAIFIFLAAISEFLKHFN